MVDIETAAMLVTDFHHKAMASQEPEPAEAQQETVISPHGPSLLEPQVAYSSGPVSLPQMPMWDSMLPHPVDGAKSNSMSSSMSGSQDSHFNTVANGQSHPNQLAPIMERQSSTNETLAPSFPSIQSSLQGSGLATPGALSPYPLMGPVSPVDYRRSPGPSQALTMAKAPKIDSEEACVKILENIRRCDSQEFLVDSFHLPSVTLLNRYLATYFNLFHHHLPFLHPASFDPTTISAPLLLAVLSIGALYTFDQDQAYMLHIGAKVLVNQFLQHKENFSSRKCPLWTMQSTLLNMIFASWSGDPKGLEWACSIKSLLANVSKPQIGHLVVC